MLKLSWWKKALGIPEDKRRNFVSEMDRDIKEENKAIMNENASLKAQIGRIMAIERAKQEAEKDKESEQGIIKDLNEQQDKINKQRIGDTISFRKFFFRLFDDNRFAEKLEIFDKDGKTSMGNFGDILISKKDKTIMITDADGNILSRGYRLDHIIYKPETLDNQLNKNFMLIPKDENMKFVVTKEVVGVDPDSIEISEMVWNEKEKKWESTEEFTARARDLIIKYKEALMERNQIIERLEKTQIEQKKRIDDLTRIKNISKSSEQTVQSELTQTVNLNMQMVSKMGDYQRQITQLSEMKALNEAQIETFKIIVEKLLKKIEKSGDETLYEQSKEEVYTDLERMKNLLPETVNIEAPEHKEETRMPQPGEVIGQKRNV